MYSRAAMPVTPCDRFSLTPAPDFRSLLPSSAFRSFQKDSWCTILFLSSPCLLSTKKFPWNSGGMFREIHWIFREKVLSFSRKPLHFLFSFFRETFYIFPTMVTVYINISVDCPLFMEGFDYEGWFFVILTTFRQKQDGISHHSLLLSLRQAHHFLNRKILCSFFSLCSVHATWCGGYDSTSISLGKILVKIYKTVFHLRFVGRSIHTSYEKKYPICRGTRDHVGPGERAW